MPFQECSKQAGVNTFDWTGGRRRSMEEVPMTNLMIRIATLATCSIALIAAFSVTPVVAVGSDPGGGEANYGGVDQRSPYPPSSYPKRSGTRATPTPQAKKAQQTPFDKPPLPPRVRAAYSTIYHRHC